MEPSDPTEPPETSVSGEAPASSPPPEPAAPQSPADAVAALEQEKKAIHDRMLRIAADFENFKKRARRENEDAQARAKEQVLRELLPVADNLERALAHAGGADPGQILDGVRLVLRQLATALEKLDVRPIEAVGKGFDPAHHEAIQQVETAAEQPGTVVSELQRGYLLGERLLRPALVVVAKAPPAPEPPEPPAPDGAASLGGEPDGAGGGNE